MTSKFVARCVLSTAFAAIAVVAAITFLTMPVEFIESCNKVAKPDGSGTFFTVVFASLAAIVVLFMPDWE